MLESSSTAHQATWNPAKLDHFLAQVQALVEMYNLQRKELLDTKSALLEAQSELNAAKRSMALQSIQQTEAADFDIHFPPSRCDACCSRGSLFSNANRKRC